MLNKKDGHRKSGQLRLRLCIQKLKRLESVYCAGRSTSQNLQCTTGQSEQQSSLINSPRTSRPRQPAPALLLASDSQAMRDIRCYRRCRLRGATAKGYSHNLTVRCRDYFFFSPQPCFAHIIKQIVFNKKKRSRNHCFVKMHTLCPISFCLKWQNNYGVITRCEIPALLEAACSCLWPISEADGCKVKRVFCVAAFYVSWESADDFLIGASLLCLISQHWPLRSINTLMEIRTCEKSPL